ncbi:HAD family hydrolase [Xylanibacillus composti]|uniref:Hydrolase of the HAD superfamily n=1 Tax=Xylanibacillus composti TaxID=1572762 RepID=A0A8J4H2I2_9BACL|nr:HAD-IA family hydrolase [Xylanibacillus composti]MDT9723524.1 HAD family hydrolase [Xylanibacillus composti]GIQ68440.1 hypothetical protein XYCOK13_12640 [Xylanibacillus composti]
MEVFVDRYKAILFDAGDTLLNVPEAHQVVTQFLRERSFPCDEAEVESVLHESIQRFYYEKKRDEQAICSPEVDRAFWVKLYAHMLTRLNGANCDEDGLRRLCHDLYEVFTGPEVYTLFEDVTEVLEALRMRGLQLAVVSNFADTLPLILREKGIADYFSEIIVSTTVGLEKPNPEIFRYALRKLRVDPGDALYIGDHEQNDVWAPKQAGMDAIRILRYGYMQGEGIRSLLELLPGTSNR